MLESKGKQVLAFAGRKFVVTFCHEKTFVTSLRKVQKFCRNKMIDKFVACKYVPSVYTKRQILYVEATKKAEKPQKWVKKPHFYINTSQKREPRGRNDHLWAF